MTTFPLKSNLSVTDPSHTQDHTKCHIQSTSPATCERPYNHY
ncbi:hypothetical protein [Rubritalea tangerina]